MSTYFHCHICENDEYVDFTLFPAVTTHSWRKEFSKKDNRFLYFCSDICLENYKWKINREKRWDKSGDFDDDDDDWSLF